MELYFINWKNVYYGEDFFDFDLFCINAWYDPTCDCKRVDICFKDNPIPGKMLVELIIDGMTIEEMEERIENEVQQYVMALGAYLNLPETLLHD